MNNWDWYIEYEPEKLKKIVAKNERCSICKFDEEPFCRENGCDEGISNFFDAEHEELPPLDSNGKVIKVGDIVKHLECRNAVVVSELTYESNGQWHFDGKETDDNPDGLGGTFSSTRSRWWTIVEPDSQKKINADMKKPFCDYFGGHGTVCSECEFVKTHEGKRPWIVYKLDECLQAKWFDLGMRQAKLDAGDVS